MVSTNWLTRVDPLLRNQSAFPSVRCFQKWNRRTSTNWAQFVDVRLFHFWKQRTEGKALWLRNNGSTLVSQFVDTTAVVLISHYGAHVLPVRGGEPVLPQLAAFIASGYLFKAIAAAMALNR